MGRGLVGLLYLGAGTIRPEVMKQGPGAYLFFSRRPMTVKETGTEQPAGHRFHVPVNHVAGAVSGGVVKGQRKESALAHNLVIASRAAPVTLS